MSINNREDANNYYQLINGLVDEYVENYKIRPSMLRSYFKPNGDRFQRFLKKNGLDSVKGANQVLNDVIDDRVSLEKDGVITFETFKYFESSEFKINSLRECLWRGIEKSTLSQEKILADYFDTNLSHISVVDTNKHIFLVSDWEGETKAVVIYSEEELDIIKNNFIEYLYNEISNKKIEVGFIEIELNNLIKKQDFTDYTENKFDKELTTKTITECLGKRTNWDFESFYNNHFIWVS